MILVVIVIRRVGDEVFHGREVSDSCSQEFRGVCTEILGSEHSSGARDELKLATDGDINLGSHASIALGGDDDDTVGTLCTVDSSTISEHLHLVDVIDIDVSEDIVVISIVEHGAFILHIQYYAIHYDERLRGGFQRVETIDEHYIAQSLIASTADRADFSAETLLDEWVDALLGIVVKVGCHGEMVASSGFLVTIGEGVAEESGIDIIEIRAYSHLNGRSSFERDEEAVDIIRHADGVIALGIGHGRVAFVAVCLDLHAGKRLASGSICHLTLDVLCLSIGERKKHKQAHERAFLHLLYVINEIFHI